MEKRFSERFIRLPEVEKMVGFKRSSIYAMVSDGSFPKPLNIGPRAVAWRLSEVRRWMRGKISSRESHKLN